MKTFKEYLGEEKVVPHKGDSSIMAPLHGKGPSKQFDGHEDKHKAYKKNLKILNHPAHTEKSKEFHKDFNKYAQHLTLAVHHAYAAGYGRSSSASRSEKKERHHQDAAEKLHTKILNTHFSKDERDAGIKHLHIAGSAAEQNHRLEKGLNHAANG